VHLIQCISTRADSAFLCCLVPPFRQLAELEEDEGLMLTPFERNLEVWRQLWRVLERSDIVVQVRGKQECNSWVTGTHVQSCMHEAWLLGW
jgi:hypothetical protein